MVVGPYQIALDIAVTVAAERIWNVKIVLWGTLAVQDSDEKDGAAIFVSVIRDINHCRGRRLNNDPGSAFTEYEAPFVGKKVLLA